eukprot:GHVU01103915.1.p1 GENE.GHVU01103915.1~~GHVU01103915.1.p1  ORF type:complete len:119 (-),score=4.53 GHVU01103915.1:516-872(-)
MFGFGSFVGSREEERGSKREWVREQRLGGRSRLRKDRIIEALTTAQASAVLHDEHRCSLFAFIYLIHSFCVRIAILSLLLATATTANRHVVIFSSHTATCSPSVLLLVYVVPSRYQKL